MSRMRMDSSVFARVRDKVQQQQQYGSDYIDSEHHIASLTRVNADLRWVLALSSPPKQKKAPDDALEPQPPASLAYQDTGNSTLRDELKYENVQLSHRLLDVIASQRLSQSQIGGLSLGESALLSNLHQSHGSLPQHLLPPPPNPLYATLSVSTLPTKQIHHTTARENEKPSTTSEQIRTNRDTLLDSVNRNAEMLEALEDSLHVSLERQLTASPAGLVNDVATATDETETPKLATNETEWISDSVRHRMRSDVFGPHVNTSRVESTQSALFVEPENNDLAHSPLYTVTFDSPRSPLESSPNAVATGLIDTLIPDSLETPTATPHINTYTHPTVDHTPTTTAPPSKYYPSGNLDRSGVWRTPTGEPLSSFVQKHRKRTPRQLKLHRTTHTSGGPNTHHTVPKTTPSKPGEDGTNALIEERRRLAATRRELARVKAMLNASENSIRE